MPHGNKYILSDLALTKTGLTIRDNIKLQRGEPITVLQPKDIIDGALSGDPLGIDYSSVKSIGNHFLEKGDLLIANKGVKFATFMYNDEFNRCIASASFFVVRTYKEKCTPRFLQWYLEQEPAKEYMKLYSVTATIPSLTKSALDLLPVPLPDLTVQQKIGYLVEIFDKEQALLLDMLNKTKEYRNARIWELIKS
jgi:restriction endonuclease S subunit